MFICKYLCILPVGEKPEETKDSHDDLDHDDDSPFSFLERHEVALPSFSLEPESEQSEVRFCLIFAIFICIF